MGNEKYDELMKRWLTNQVTEAERVKIEAWLETIKLEYADELELSNKEAEELYNKITSEKNNIKEIQAFKPESIRKKTRLKWMIRAAAGLFLAAIAIYAMWGLGSRKNQEFIAENGIKKVILNDGTLVWLHGSSKLSYYEKSDGRFAELDGEALFEVTKDASRPFSIEYKDVNVRVVGTSFSLKTGDSVQLLVLTGKVNLSSSSNKQGVNIFPNEKAFYTLGNGITKFPLLKDEAMAVVTDTEYNMQFTNATFSKVIKKLEKKFDVTIKLMDDDIVQCHINLDITDHSLESSLQMIASVLNVEYHVAGNEIKISGTGCK
jgi:transmembrane sensor